MVAVPDWTRDLIYFVGEKSIKARRLKSGVPEVGSQAVAFPASYLGNVDDRIFTDPARQRYLQHIAVTVGDKLLLYLLTALSLREIYCVRLSAFADKPDAPAPVEKVPATDRPPPPVEGKEFKHQLPNGGGKETRSPCWPARRAETGAGRHGAARLPEQGPGW